MIKNVFKIVYFFLFIALSVNVSNAQNNNYYYANNTMQYWTTDSSSANIIVKNLCNYNAIVANLNAKFANYSNYEIFYDDEDDNIVIYCPELRNMNISSLLNAISVNNDDISFFSFSKILDGNSRIWLRNDIYVKLSDTTKFQQYVIGMFSSYNVVSYNYEGNGEYRLVCSNELKMMQLANSLHDSSWTIYSTPDFYSGSGLSTNDELYPNQWALRNIGQNNGTPNVDINVESAWSFLQNATGTLGNNIKIAVVDDGVEEHDDLYFAGGVSKVLPGYTANGNGTGRPLSTGFHGECCAGIISAVHNNIYVAGVAPNTYIVPIRIFRKETFFTIPYTNNPLFFSNRQIADAIRKAYIDFDVQIINCSWTKPDSDKVRYAIADAVTLGRNNKGCILVGSFGNNNSHTFPSTAHPNTISVGAIDWNGEKCSFSNAGEQLSVVAPGIGIYTIDRMGVFGNNNAGNYISNFDGTSAAAPHVSGVAALMLSANPNLTSGQVKTIIEQTAQKVGGYNYQTDNIHPNGTWCDSIGYGLVNAHKAVMHAYFYDYTINGTNTSLSPCSEYTYSLSNSTIPNGVSFSWEISNNLEIVSEQGTSITVRPIGYGACWIKANFTHEGCTVTKTKNSTVTSGYTSTIYKNYTVSGTAPITIDADAVISGPFTISSGSTVTISTTVHCSPSAKIVIQPGGKLIVDGGTLTNLCPNKMWDAIYVVGNYYQRQLAQYQGTIEVKNNSVIENSKWGIVTWDGSNYATSGGIVKCSSSTFRNNGKAIEFYPYTNHNSSGAETDNVNYAQKCTFVVDGNNLFASNNITFSEFVKISHVRGVSFKGSSFRDGRATADSNTKGIYSDGAGFTASELCLYYNSNAPCDCVETATRTKFSRLGYGIYAVNDGTTYNFTADHAIFDTCYRAVQIDAVNSIKVTRSDFDQTSQGVFSGSSATGVYLNNSTGYTIEANSFATNYSTCPSGFMGRGVYVYNSGTSANTIYRNTMSKLYHGIKSNSGNGGLQLLCNEFSGNFYADINVLGAISSSQGSSSKSAGNKFTSGVKKIYSPLTSITYYHSGANGSSNDYCPYYSNSTVSLIPNITANNCAPTICIPITPPPGPKSAPENDDITLYESLQQMYNARLTEYNAAGYDFLLENFDENDADIVAIARLKQDTLISLSRTMAEIANRNLNAILADSVLDRESLNGWYNRISTQTAKYSLANSYFEIGEYALARQELAAIPQHFALSADELAEYDNFCDYNALRESVFTSGRNYAQLTEEEIAELEAIADLNTGVSSAYANSVLCFFYGICREIDEAEIDDTPMNNKNAVASVEENSERESLAVYVYPNPADDELNILINSLPEGTTTIEFHDVAGRLMLSHEITSTNASIDISSLKQGIYMYRIVNDDNVIARDRIVKE